jgi:nucleotide-binding universal stress UspA family protein
MKRILVPTDFSDFAMSAAKVAAKIAHKTGAEIYFLHVLTIPSYETGILPYQNKQEVAEGLYLLKHVREKFDKLFKQDFLKGIKCVEAVSFELVYDSIAMESKKNDIDLIVMGTHGTSGFVSDYFVGSNTDKVVRLSDVPVIAVKEDSGDISFSKILFAGDFSEKIDQSFEPVKQFAKIYDAELLLLHVVTKGEFFYTGPLTQRMQEFAENHKLTKFSCHVFNAESVQTGINEFANMENVDMIATVTSGRRGLALLFNGSVTTDIVNKVNRPVMTVRV